MSEAPERIWASSDWKRIDQGTWWDVNPGGDSEEYIRTDLVRAQIEAAVKRALEGAAECCDVAAQDGIGDIVRAKSDEIRALDPAQFIDGDKP